MKKHLFCILIAEPDHAFRRKLRNTFATVQASLPAVKFNFIEPDSHDEIVSDMRSRQPDMVFINTEYLLEKNGRIINHIKSRKKKLQFIMLISDNGGNKIKQLIEGLEKERPLYLSGHINKDNFSFELLAILIRFFVRRSGK